VVEIDRLDDRVHGLGAGRPAARHDRRRQIVAAFGAVLVSTLLSLVGGAVEPSEA